MTAVTSCENTLYYIFEHFCHAFRSTVSSEARIGRAQKREVGGRGGERKETLADRPRDFEKRPL